MKIIWIFIILIIASCQNVNKSVGDRTYILESILDISESQMDKDYQKKLMDKYHSAHLEYTNDSFLRIYKNEPSNIDEKYKIHLKIEDSIYRYYLMKDSERPKLGSDTYRIVIQSPMYVFIELTHDKGKYLFVYQRKEAR